MAAGNFACYAKMRLCHLKLGIAQGCAEYWGGTDIEFSQAITFNIVFFNKGEGVLNLGILMAFHVEEL